MCRRLFYRVKKMNITFFKNTIPKSHIARTLSQPLTVTGEPREADTLDILNPIINFQYNAALLQYNFAYIPDFGGRYYFINDLMIKGKTIEVSFHVDVLYTYRNVILSSQCIAERSASNYELMLEDDAVSALSGYDVFSRSLPYEFRPDMGRYVLAVAGG